MSDEVTDPNECRVLYNEPTRDRGLIKLGKVEEGYQLWYHGECVWKSYDRPAVKTGVVYTSDDSKELGRIIDLLSPAHGPLVQADLILRLYRSRPDLVVKDALDLVIAIIADTKERIESATKNDIPF